MTNEDKIKKYVLGHNPDVVKIFLTKQAGLYIKHNIEPLDMFYNEGTLVFVFDKSKTNEVYTKWRCRTLD